MLPGCLLLLAACCVHEKKPRPSRIFSTLLLLTLPAYLTHAQDVGLDTTPGVVDAKYYTDLITDKADEVIDADENMLKSSTYRTHINSLSNLNTNSFHAQMVPVAQKMSSLGVRPGSSGSRSGGTSNTTSAGGAQDEGLPYDAELAASIMAAEEAAAERRIRSWANVALRSE